MQGNGVPEATGLTVSGSTEPPVAGPGLGGVRLRVGVRHAVVPGGMGRAFGLVTDACLPPDAPVEVVVTPATVSCRACGGYGQSTDLLVTCPWCGATDVDVSDGDEVVLVALRFGRP